MKFDSSIYRTSMVAALGLALTVCGGCFLMSPDREKPRSEFDLDDDDDYDDCMGWGAGGMSSGNGGEIAPPNAERLIAEADIVHIDGGLLYALGDESGLSVVDVSVRDELVLLDQLDIDGLPSEMYVRDGTAFILYDKGFATHQSHVTAVDASLPSDLQHTGTVGLAGHVSDTRIVGDVLYVVTYETHDCSSCPSLPTTTITSIDLLGGELQVVDSLSYEQAYADDVGWKRSVMATAERMYVAGVEWDGVDSAGHSTIHVVDISNPGGALVEGASVQAAGQILNRWQMDEREGVLRVVSQPGVWATDEVPTVQTFAVDGAQTLTPLGSLELELPEPESLRSVRFDGDRVYAITAQPAEPYDPTPGSNVPPPPIPPDSCGPMCDPLFIIDLSDPALPTQLGELEMPGWVFHMEPRGDRLLALGFESTYPLGELSVSMFDVSDTSDPKMLDRVTFGGEWTGLAEDQNRIHKSFSIVDELGLIMVPYGWFEWQSDVQCDDGSNDPCGWGSCWDNGDWERRGAVQLVEFGANHLTRRGEARLEGWAKRARIHDTRLLAVAEEAMASFDIDDRSHPQQTATLSF